jgi:TonB family protein
LPLRKSHHLLSAPFSPPRYSPPLFGWPCFVGRGFSRDIQTVGAKRQPLCRRRLFLPRAKRESFSFPPSSLLPSSFLLVPQLCYEVFMMFRFSHWPRLLLAAALFAALATPTAAQHSDMDPLAKKFAGKLKAGPTRAIVAGFTDERNLRSPLGVQLAGEFAAALLRFSPGLDLVSPEEFNRIRKAEMWTEIEARDFSVARSLALQLGVRLFITGSFEREIDGLRLHVQALDFRKNKVVAASSSTILLTPERERLDEQRFGLRHREKDPALAKAAAGNSALAFHPGKNGVSVPVCQRCPDPVPTKEAVAEKYVGRVILKIVVTPEGRTENIRVVQGAKYGLTESAMKAVARWKFKPAKDSKGNPVPVEITVEVAFRTH